VSAMARPMPLLAPVTSATRPVRPRSMNEVLADDSLKRLPVYTPGSEWAWTLSTECFLRIWMARASLSA
jgi:hypothetical protein